MDSTNTDKEMVKNMLYADIKKKIEDAIEADIAELICYNDSVADEPELSGQEYKTSQKIAVLMRNHGFHVELPFVGIPTAFRAVKGSNDHKYKVAVLAEYDALPEIGHACGHCVSGAMSMLAAISMAELQEELNCDVHLIGTPYEETCGAKVDMVNLGVFDDYDMAIMIHLNDRNLVSCNLLALHEFYITFHGKAAHGASAPWDGINALNAAQLFMHAMDCYRQHVTPDVRMHGVYTNGGGAANIVPERAEIELYTRALNKNYLTNVVDDRILKMIEGACLMTGATSTIEHHDNPYDNLLKNKTGTETLTDTFHELGIEISDFDGIFGSSDIGNVSFVCPAFHPTLKLVEEGIAVHTRAFADAVKTDTAHKNIALGAEIICLQIVKIFSDEAKVQQMKADFEAGRLI